MNLETIQASSADGSTMASFVPGAGIVCCSLTVDAEQRLSLRKGLEAYATQGSTMGIPLLYPWANRLGAHRYRAAGKTVELPEDPARVHHEASGLPLHGVTPSLMQWRAQPPEANRVTAELGWEEPPLLELFPFAHRARLTAEVGPGTLTVTTTVQATQDDHLPVCFGFHPYLALSGADRSQWEVVLPPCRGLALDERALPTGERVEVDPGAVPLADRAFDDAYELTPESARFVARAPGREIVVEMLEGFGFAQVFSPAGADFVCFEPMTAPANALRSGDGLRVLAPGEEHRTRFRVVLAR